METMDKLIADFISEKLDEVMKAMENPSFGDDIDWDDDEIAEILRNAG